MNRFLVFIGGMFTGALLLYFVASIVSTSPQERFRQQIFEKLANDLDDANEQPETQYVEVRGKKGRVELHTGMPKDSVRIRVGKPDDVDLYLIGDKTRETWRYYIKDKYISDLNIKFENGRLIGIN